MVQFIPARWKDALKDTPAFILGNGPSLSDYDLSPLANRFTIGINRALKPNVPFDPTLLLWSSPTLVRELGRKLLDCESLKVCRRAAAIGDCFTFYCHGDDYDYPPAPHIFKGTASSGPTAVQLAWLLGCNPIVLLGFDCCYRGERTDFYGRNPHHAAGTLPNCAKGLEWIATVSDRDVINCSANEVVSPRMSLADTLILLGDEGTAGREEWRERLRA